MERVCSVLLGKTIENGVQFYRHREDKGTLRHYKTSKFEDNAMGKNKRKKDTTLRSTKLPQ